MTAALSSRKGGRRGFRSDASGVAAVEFSIILPFALALMALVVYGGQLYRVQRKVSLGAATVANLVAQGGNTAAATISTAEMNQILAYPNLILYPNDSSALEVVVSELKVTVVSGVGTATVSEFWANTNATNAHATPTCNQQVPIDANIVNALNGPPGNSGVYYVIQGQVLNPFQPYDLYGSVAAVTLHDSVLMIPRTSDTGVTGPNPPC